MNFEERSDGNRFESPTSNDVISQPKTKRAEKRKVDQRADLHERSKEVTLEEKKDKIVTDIRSFQAELIQDLNENSDFYQAVPQAKQEIEKRIADIEALIQAINTMNYEAIKIAEHATAPLPYEIFSAMDYWMQALHNREYLASTRQDYTTQLRAVA